MGVNNFVGYIWDEIDRSAGTSNFLGSIVQGNLPDLSVFGL